MHGRWTAFGFCLVVALATVTSCAEKVDPAVAAAKARQEEMASLRQEKEALEALRAQKQQIAQQLESASAEQPAAEEGSEAPTAEDLQTQLTQLETNLETQAGDFYQHVVEFINSDPPVEGEPRTEIQNEAITLKSDEDMLLAQEYIDKGGDYRRAISIYQDALRVDPDNAKLQQALAQAEEMRWMTQERFSQVKKGMTEAQVRELLGQPNLFNVRDYEDKGVTAWFYPKDEAGAAAAVWFRGKDKKVYRVNFNELEGKGEEQGSEG